jgi:hypothetical protein
MLGRRWKRGTPVIFRKCKHGSTPGPRAHSIHPETRGEGYWYHVDKFWLVVEQRLDGTLIVVTRGGKQHVVSSSDPNLRRANWWEWWRFRDRFPTFPADDGWPESQPSV